MVAVVSSPSISGAAQAGSAIGDALTNFTKAKLVADAQKTERELARAKIELIQNELKKQLGYQDAAQQAADIFGNLNPAAGQQPQQQAQGQQGVLPPDFAPMPQGIGDGSVGSSLPARQQAEWDGLEKYRGAVMQKALPLINRLDPATQQVFVGALQDQLKTHAAQLHRNQVSATMHDAVTAGAFDPTDPLTGKRIPDEAVRQQILQLVEQGRAGDDAAFKKIDDLQTRSLESHVAASQRAAAAGSAQAMVDQMRASGRPVPDKAVALADQIRSNPLMDPKMWEPEMFAALNGLPGPAEIESMKAQASAELNQLRAENEKLKLLLAPKESAAKVEKLEAGAEKARRPNTGNLRMPLGPLPADRRTIAAMQHAIRKAGGTKAWAELSQEERDARADAAEQELTPPPEPEPPNAIDSLMQSRSLPFGPGRPAPNLSETIGEKPAGKGKKTKAERVQELVDEGKSDEEIRAAIKKEFPE